jgi:hypothetical protein
VHRIRRAAIAPFYNRNRVREYGPYIQSVADRISYRLATEYVGTGKVVNLMHLFGSMTSDVIMDLAFARPMHFADAPDFISDFNVATTDLMFTAHVLTHFGFILTAMNMLPNWFVKVAIKPIKSVIEFREVSTKLRTSRWR